MWGFPMRIIFPVSSEKNLVSAHLNSISKNLYSVFMNSRERVKAIIAGEPADRCAYWSGNPHSEAWPGIHEYFGTSDEEAVRQILGDDARWISAGFCGFSVEKYSHGQKGPFAEVEDPAAVENYPWPEASKLDFSAALEHLSGAGDVYRMSGLWTSFYHNVMDLFGMEDYLIKMLLNPDVVHAVTNRVCEFYYEANEQFFTQAGDMVDGFFFGNDFGTQRDLICGPDQFDQFILPWMIKFTQQGHRYGHQIILHSCGSIHKVINRLINCGVDCIHPLQAKASNMDALTLARDFGGKITFMGGIDTQELLVHASPEEIRKEVNRVKGILGPRCIISPSHEAILKNVPPANIEAMARAVTEDG